jgi:chromosome segregation protein
VIDPAPTYETAVEAALGESLQYILVHDQPSGANAIGYLQQNQAGRCGFIPVGGVRAVDDRPDKHPEPDRLLLNHLRVKEGFESVTDALLGHVVSRRHPGFGAGAIQPQRPSSDRGHPGR